MASLRTPIAATLLLICAGPAFAASSIDLTVKGLITPSACTPALAQGGVADYGKIAAKDLQENQATPLPPTTLPFNLSCEAATLFALNGVDNRAGSASSPNDYSYGLGFINETERVGDYVIIITNYLADNLPVSKLASRDNGATWSENSEDAIWMRGRLAAFGNNASGTWAPIAIKALTSNLVVHPTIAPSSGLTLTQEQPVDGSATLEVMYL
ncbi:DUF1120 domain-containing protein [Pseudomonas edaphica]|jgi:hypothetical protein|uniref:DUF1120 domain-containing protein n=1 Tax=Pseudomonas edaphica TaxID=2006980 RepID=A0A5R8R5D0_9PSED|nr:MULTISPECIES: DUF1120 domain-containing protein [Pseudomonas]NMX57490.1 DUF1120 domain-containing protein [Pseudomonas sp. WS 5146]NVZ56890.1 DUF1120 domain-containing protein [Pseudomonas edaphica]NWC44864.1 DUF1120 domain-containing protein [Pseudomonas sp. IPO3747]NWE06148.1 DUF1120 domain-containing protein [Pseudomonas edaphica]NWE83589.1 DUF1120 domain-containing protein [Pseudomonas edaphica]